MQLWTVPLSLMTESHAQFSCCSLPTTTGFSIEHFNRVFTFIFFFLKTRSQPVQSFRKYIKNKSISNCPGPTSIQQLPDFQFVWYMTGQYFKRFDDPNTPLSLSKRLLLLFFQKKKKKIHSGQKLTEKLWKTYDFFSKPVSVFVNYLKWVSYKRNRTSCKFAKKKIIKKTKKKKHKVVWQPCKHFFLNTCGPKCISCRSQRGGTTSWRRGSIRVSIKFSWFL